jgi:type IV pilus assembly protein PilB
MSETQILLRFRIDGHLVPVGSLSIQEYKLLLERMKYKSELKLNITNIPQDGKYQILAENGKIDVRISTLPIKIGENVVCRVLDSTQSIPKIEELGFMWSAKRQIEKSLQKSSGMILVT